LLVVAVVGVAIWFVYERQRTAVTSCRVFLLRIDAAKQAWAIDHKANASDVQTWQDLVGKYIRERPKCPQGGRVYDWECWRGTALQLYLAPI